jgi:hypothetical protein
MASPYHKIGVHSAPDLCAKKALKFQWPDFGAFFLIYAHMATDFNGLTPYLSFAIVSYHFVT